MVKKDGAPTLKQIAFIAGLSVSTVSRSLLDGQEIKDTTKKRVKAIADALGYIPNASAVKLRTGRTNSLVFLNPENEYLGVWGNLASSLSKALVGTRFTLSIRSSTTKDGLSVLREIIQSRAADGVFLVGSETYDARLELLHQHSISFVSYGKTGASFDHSYVELNFGRFAMAAADTLRGLGRRRFALISGTGADIDPNVLELCGDYGSEYQASIVSFSKLPGRNHIDAWSEKISEILAGDETIDGIVACDTATTIAAATACSLVGRELGRSIDIAGICYHHPVALCRPDIHWFEHDLSSVGRSMADILVSFIQDRGASKQVSTTPLPFERPASAQMF